jgi:hypothetical protein
MREIRVKELASGKAADDYMRVPMPTQERRGM